MKSLHLIKTTTGATWALRQIQVLVQLGCAIHIVLPEDSGMANAYRDAGATVHIAKIDLARLKNPFSLLAALWKFRKKVLCINPDVVHSHFVGTTLFMRLALLGVNVPRIFQVPGPLHLENWLTRSVEVMSATKSDYWIATCKRTRDYYLASNINPKRVFLTFYGTNIKAFSPKVEGVLHKELSIDKTVKIIGMVAFAYPPKRWLGQTRGIKGHEDLIDAMAIILSKRTDVICVFVGGAWGRSENYYNSIVNYAKERLNDKAFFLGTRTDVIEIYPDLDIAVHPSHSENLGGAAESLLMGVPTLTTNIGGFPDVVINGETGWTVPPRDPQRLASTILAILECPGEARRRSAAGRMLAEQLLDVNKTAADVLFFYQEILNKHRSL